METPPKGIQIQINLKKWNNKLLDRRYRQVARSVYNLNEWNGSEKWQITFWGRSTKDS